MASQCGADSTKFLQWHSSVGLFQLSFSSGVPVYPASIRWVAQWYPSVHWVNQWHSSVHWISQCTQAQGKGCLVRFSGTVAQGRPYFQYYNKSDSKIHGANMGPIWGRQDPGGPGVGPMNFAIWEALDTLRPLSPIACSKGAPHSSPVMVAISICETDVWP